MIARSPLVAYGAAAALTAAAVLIRVLLDPWLGNQESLSLVFGAVVFAVWFAGYRPAIASAVLGFLACDWLFIDPRGTFGFYSPRDLVALLNYTIACTAVIAFGEAMRAARRRAEVSEARVKQEAAQRASAEEELRENENRFRAFMENSPINAFIKDEEGRYVYVNPRVGGGSMRAASTWLGKTDTELGFHEAEQYRAHDRAVLQAGESGRYEETFTSHEQVRHFLSFKFPLAGRAGRRYLGGISLDITERKHAEEELLRLNAELRRADRRKDEFLATLAHELRNPLASVRNAVQIQQANQSGSPLGWTWKVVDRQSGHMSRLLEELLDVSRVSRDRIVLRKSRITLASVVESAVETSRPLIDSGAHELTVVLPTAPVHLDADPLRLAQVFSNLLHNAAKYTPSGGRIAVRAERQRSDVVVSVTDNGSGIDPQRLPGIFEMFANNEFAATVGHGGLGVGLSLARALVGLHEGRIEARSDGVGKGSEFIVHLPCIAESFIEEYASSDTAESRDPIASPRRLLVVDDIKDNADTLTALLRTFGHEVHTVYGGADAVAAAESFRPDAVLLDIGMSNMDGYSACRHIRSQSWGQQMFLVALTGWGQDDDRRRAGDAGFNRHMVKPVDIGELVRTLAALEPAR